MTIDIDKNTYNNFSTIPFIPEILIGYMIQNNDLIWKLLQYNTADAWKDSVPNLTSDQKRLLVYDGLKEITDCRVFMDSGQDNAWRDQVTILRIMLSELIPSNYVYGMSNIVFQVYTHYKINTLSNYATRNVLIGQQLIQLFNGQDIGGIGRLSFDKRSNSSARAVIAGSIPFKCFQITMATQNLG